MCGAVGTAERSKACSLCLFWRLCKNKSLAPSLALQRQDSNQQVCPCPDLQHPNGFRIPPDWGGCVCALTTACKKTNKHKNLLPVTHVVKKKLRVQCDPILGETTCAAWCENNLVRLPWNLMALLSPGGRGGLAQSQQTGVHTHTHTPKNRCLKHTCSIFDEYYLLQSYIFA